jgi:hypothetical protein
MGIIMKNAAIINANTAIAGHSEWFPEEDFENFLDSYCNGDENAYDYDGDTLRIEISEEDFLHKCRMFDKRMYEENGVHKNGQYDLFMNQDEVDDYDERKSALDFQNTKFEEYEAMAEKVNQRRRLFKLYVDVKNKKLWTIYKDKWNFIFDDGMLEGWMVFPDGSDAFSDYGIGPINKLISQYHEGMSPEDTLVLINKILDVAHCRGDLASAFIQGGRKSLSQVSNGIVEGTKKIRITEQQFKRLCKKSLIGI